MALQDPEAEQGILSLLLSVPTAYQELETQLHGDLFSVETCRHVFESICEVAENGDLIEPLHIFTALRRRNAIDGLKLTVNGVKEQCGSVITALGLLYNPAFASKCSGWVKSLKEHQKRRSVLSASLKASKGIHDGLSADEVIAGYEADMRDTMDAGADNSITQTCLADVQVRFDRRNSDEGSLGLQTGIEAWDESLGGILPGTMTVIGARPKVGKTALVEQAIENLLEMGQDVMMVQKDMSPTVMLERMACRRARIEFQKYIKGACHSGEMKDFQNALKTLTGLARRLHLYNTRKLTAVELSALIRKERRKHGITSFFVDQFQHLQYEGKHRVEGMEANSREVRDIINETQIPGVLIAQVTAPPKGVRDRDGNPVPAGRPTSGEFKWCDQLFSDTDVAILLFSLEDPATLPAGQHQQVIFAVDANRMGGVGDETLSFNRPLMTFQ